MKCLFADGRYSVIENGQDVFISDCNFNRIEKIPELDHSEGYKEYPMRIVDVVRLVQHNYIRRGVGLTELEKIPSEHEWVETLIKFILR